MNNYAALAIVAFFTVFQSCAEEIPKKITGKMGDDLVRLLFNSSRNLEVDEAEGLQDNFLVYAVIGEREGMKSDYGVNPWTGDVWNLWECKIVSNPALEKFQVELKRNYTPEELKQYQKLRMLRPLNIGLDPC